MPALTVSTTDHRGGLAGRSVSPFECRVQSVARVAPSAVIVLVIAHSVVDAGYRSRKCDPGRWHLQPRHSLPGGAVREGSRSPRCDHDSHRRPAHPAGLSFLQPMHDFGLCASFFAVLVACTMVGARIFFGMSNEGIPRGWLGHALPRIVLSSSALWWEESSELPCCECGSSKWRKAPVSVPIRPAGASVPSVPSAPGAPSWRIDRVLALLLCDPAVARPARSTVAPEIWEQMQIPPGVYLTHTIKPRRTSCAEQSPVSNVARRPGLAAASTSTR